MCVEIVQFYVNLCAAFCFQCGQPNDEDNCRACGARIGGRNHRLVADNALIAKLVHVMMFLSFIALSCWCEVVLNKERFHYVKLLSSLVYSRSCLDLVNKCALVHCISCLFLKN